MKLMSLWGTVSGRHKTRNVLVPFSASSQVDHMIDATPVPRARDVEPAAPTTETLTEVDDRPRSRGKTLENLGEWVAHWEEVIASRTPLTERGIDLLVDRLIILRFLTLRMKSSEIMGDLGVSSDHSFSVTELFEMIWRRFGMEAFRPDIMIDDCEVAEAVALEMCRDAVGRKKRDFTIDSILESFNRGDPSEKALTRVVADDCELLEGLITKHADSCTPFHIQIDVDQLGYRTVLKVVDIAIDCHERRNSKILAEIKAKKMAVDELDLFSSAAVENEHPAVQNDVCAKVIGEKLKANCTSLRQRRIVKLLLTLKIIERKLKSGPLTDFPAISQVFTGFHPAKLKGCHHLENGTKIWKI